MKNTIRSLFRLLSILLGVVGICGGILFYLSRQIGDRSRVVIQGAGNSGNVIHVDTVVEELAAELAQRPDFATVSPDELTQIGDAVRKQALAGDPVAALVMIRVQQLQG